MIMKKIWIVDFFPSVGSHDNDDNWTESHYKSNIDAFWQYNCGSVLLFSVTISGFCYCYSHISKIPLETQAVNEWLSSTAIDRFFFENDDLAFLVWPYRALGAWQTLARTGQTERHRSFGSPSQFSVLQESQ